MTKANRKSCNQWSRVSQFEKEGICRECGHPMFMKQPHLFVCSFCGLEQQFNSEKDDEC